MSGGAGSRAWSRVIGQKSLGPGTPGFDLFPTLLTGCPTTSGSQMNYPLELDYDYAAAKHLSFGRRSGWADWSELLPPLHPRVSMPVGGTPLVDVSEVAPARQRGRGVFIKDESRNPTWSHKDRLNTFTTSAALHEGASTIIVASSGNHGVSAAAMASRAGLNCIVLTMPDVSAAFRSMIRSYGAYPVFLPSEARWLAMRALQAVAGTYPVSNLTPIHTGHPWGPEGYKTIAYEILAELDGQVPAAVVVPTGYGELLYGIYKGFAEALRLGHVGRMPQLVSIEPAARGPLYHAMKSGDPRIRVAARPTVQSGTAVTVTGYRAIVALRESDGFALLVPDDAALAANVKLCRQGLWQEISSSAAFAALNDLPDLKDDGPIIAIGCSTGLKEPAVLDGVTTSAPDIASLRVFLKTEYGFTL